MTSYFPASVYHPSIIHPSLLRVPETKSWAVHEVWDLKDKGITIGIIGNWSQYDYSFVSKLMGKYKYK